LKAAGLGELVGDSQDQFVKLAVDLAKGGARLMNLRSGLRERVCGSALMDSRKFAGEVETAYREMWTKWCGEVETRYGEKK
jgi:predicted O-linked N-acetylglucosamine transferase (SPINDLY family)